MFRMAKTMVFWPTLKADLETVYNRCERCQIHRIAKLPPPTIACLEFSQLAPMDLVNMDFCQYAGKYYLIIVDRSSGYVMVAATPDQTADTALKYL